MLTSIETTRFIALLSMKMITFAVDYRFRSSVGLEQQPSKLWVLGSNPNGITNHVKRGFWKQNPLLHLE